MQHSSVTQLMIADAPFLSLGHARSSRLTPLYSPNPRTSLLTSSGRLGGLTTTALNTWTTSSKFNLDAASEGLEGEGTLVNHVQEGKRASMSLMALRMSFDAFAGLHPLIHAHFALSLSKKTIARFPSNLLPQTAFARRTGKSFHPKGFRLEAVPKHDRIARDQLAIQLASAIGIDSNYFALNAS